MNSKTALFEPLKQNKITLKNRIVMAPMTRSRAIGSVPNELMARYYQQRASAGLIITEGVSPSPNGLGYARIPGIFNDKQIEGWKKITTAVHQNGGTIFVQLMHTGRIAHPANMPEGNRITAPSAVQAKGEMWTDTEGMQPHPIPETMAAEDIQQTLLEYRNAAENAMTAGFDGVEIHGANGYLPEQFLNPHVNLRTDSYGGSIHNRNRFLLEVTSSVADVIGKEKTGVRISPYSSFNDMPHYDETPETYQQLADELNKMEIFYIHIVEPAAREQENWNEFSTALRERFDNIWMVNGGYTGEAAEEILQKNRADLVSFGAPFISNPDLPERMKQNAALAPADPATFYTPDEKGYTDYAFLNEYV